MSKDLHAAADEAIDEIFSGETPIVKKKKKRLLEDLDPTLIPAGEQRNDAMKMIADELAEEAEDRASTEERFRLDPSRFRIENEIGSKASSLEVSYANPERAYCWARFKAENGVSQAEHKRSLTVGVRELATGKVWQEQIWHVVEGRDPEAIELKQVDGTRRLGDVILLWAKRVVHEAVQRVAEQKRQELYGKPKLAAQAFFEKTGIKVMTEADMANDPRYEKVAKHAEGFRRSNEVADAQVRDQLLAQQKARGRAA